MTRACNTLHASAVAAVRWVSNESTQLLLREELNLTLWVAESIQRLCLLRSPCLPSSLFTIYWQQCMHMSHTNFCNDKGRGVKSKQQKKWRQKIRSNFQVLRYCRITCLALIMLLQKTVVREWCNSQKDFKQCFNSKLN